MPEPTAEPAIVDVLRRAGYELPPETLPDLEHAHELLRRMLARLGPLAPETEPAVTFRPEAGR